MRPRRKQVPCPVHTNPLSRVAQAVMLEAQYRMVNASIYPAGMARETFLAALRSGRISRTME